MATRNKKVWASAAVALALMTSSLSAIAATVTVESASPQNTALDAAAVRVSWPAQSGSVGYAVIATSNQASSVRGSTPACADNTCTSFVTDLLGGISYTFSVTAVAVSGAETAVGSSNMIAVSIPGAATPVSATSSGTSATLSWNPPSNAGGLPITGCKITGVAGQADVSVSGGATSKVLDNLTPGLEYATSIYCTNANGNSASAAFRTFTVKTAPAAPAKPTAILAGTSVSVGWVAPASNGEQITGYSVYLVDSSGSDVGTATTATANASSVVVPVSTVANGTYSIQVLASNAIGTGTRSPKSNTFTIGSVTPTPTPTPSATSSATPSATPSASPSSTPSSTPSSSPSASAPSGNSGGGGGGGTGPISTPTPTLTATPTPTTPPVVIAPKPTPTPTKVTVIPVVSVKVIPGLVAGSTTISSKTQAALTAQAKTLIAGKAKQVTLTIATKGTTLTKAKAQAAAVAKALTKAGVTAVVKVTGTGSKTVVTVIATKKKK